MDKQHIQQDLNTILKEEIPDDMDILPEIHKQLQKQATTNHQPMMTLSKVAAIFVIFVLVSAGGYALIQRNLETKTIPQQIITDINETQTIEDIGVTLNWAYADAHRIVIAYSMEYEPTDTFINAPQITLTTADGTVIPQAFGGGGGGGGSSESRYSESLINYDSSVIETEPDSVDLTLTLDFSAEAIMQNPSMAHMTGGGGGGNAPAGGGGGGGNAPAGGGGGGGGNAPAGGGGGGNAPMSTPDVSQVIDRVYTFNFTLPFYQALEVEPETPSVESNDVTININNIRYTPSLTKFDICYNMPDDEQWGAQIQITTDSPDSPFFSRQLMPIDTNNTSDSHCFEATASAAIPADSDNFTIDILFLTQPLPLSQELARSEEAYFAEQGYIIEIDAEQYGYTFDILEFPDDTTEEEAYGYIQANLFFKRYEGDWTFEVPLQ